MLKTTLRMWNENYLLRGFKFRSRDVSSSELSRNLVGPYI